jgi:RNA polymerase sigma-70 factor (ECF subfamily)
MDDDEDDLNRWFCEQILPLENSLSAFIRNNWRSQDDVSDLRQEIYERVLVGARSGLPMNPRAFLYTVARHHLINRAKRSTVVSIELVADLEQLEAPANSFAPEPYLSAREELRRAQAGLEALPPRCREVVRLRKVEGLTTAEAAERIGVTVATVERQMVHGMRALVDYMLGGSGKVRRDSTKEKSGERKYDQQ